MVEFTYGFDVTVSPREPDLENAVAVRLAGELVHELTAGADYTDREAADLAVGVVARALHQVLSS